MKYVVTKIEPHLFYLFEFEQNVRNPVKQYIQNIQPGDKTEGDFSLISYKKLIGNEKDR
jgi:hypothetical protein